MRLKGWFHRSRPTELTSPRARWARGGRIARPRIAVALVLAACSDSGTDPLPEPVLDLEALFSPPTSGEISATLDEWATRSVSAEGAQIVADSRVAFAGDSATVTVVSHTGSGVLHYGAVIVPDGGSPGGMPVLFYTHGGDDGVSVEGALAVVGFAGELGRQVLLVIPSFRAEPLTFDGETYLSEGPPSPWDRDVDDALALLEVVLATIPEADPTRIGVLGFSRGATVGMLMAAREPRIDVVVEFFGATDFFSPYVREIVEEALDGMPRDLPGLDYLDETFIQPLGQGTLIPEEFRPELVRRSPVYFVDLLPQLQVHHGTEDGTVDVSQAELLIEAMTGIGRSEPDFECFIYEGGGHSPLSLAGSLTRTIEFLSRLLAT